MENIFGNIELIPVESNFYDPTPTKKQPEAPKPKECKPSGPRHTIDYQQAKRRAECIKEIHQLKSNIKETQQKNFHLYNRIISLAPDFAYVLFESKNYQNQNYGSFEEVRLLEQKLMSELDKVYEENCLLEKQMNRVKFVEQNEQKLKEENLSKNINHYQFLRNVWYQKNQPKSLYGNEKEDSTKCEDFIEKLNKKVATVRFSINHILKEEQLNESTSSFSSQIQNDFVVKSSKYQRLLSQYEQISMELQEQRSRSWNEHQTKKQFVETQNQEQSIQIQNLNSKIKQLEQKAYESQKEILLLKEQLSIKENQLTKLKNCQKSLLYIFSEKNQESEQNGISIRVFNFAQANPHKIENYTVTSKLTALIKALKDQSTLIEQKETQKSSINLYLQKISSSQNQKSISSRNSLSNIDMNKIKTDRMSLIKKTNKLTETLSGSNTLKRNVSRDKERELRVCKTIYQAKQNFDSGTLVQCYKDDSLEFPSQMASNNLLQADFKAKFVRTTNRNRREYLR